MKGSLAKRVGWIGTWLLIALATMAGRAYSQGLEEGFISPPHEARPQAWWWWLHTPTNREAITRDLEEIKAKGLGGALLMDVGQHPTLAKSWGKGGMERVVALPPGPPAFDPAWRPMVRFAAREAGRLGLDFSFFIGPGGCASAFTPPEEGQQQLVFSETSVTGGKAVDQVLTLSDKVRLGPDGKPIFYHDIAVLAVPAAGVVPRDRVIDLGAKMDAAGHLRWDAPSGQWTVLRFGHAPTFQEFYDFKYIDHLSREAFDRHWARTAEVLLKEMTPEERKSLKFVECDSWEAGSVSWTATFAEEFAARRGYPIHSWLPVLANRAVESPDLSSRFRRDYQLTISDLIVDNHYRLQTERAHQWGLLNASEASGPHQHQADGLKCQGAVDIPMGEFWAPATTHRTTDPTRFMLREAASASHIYGKRLVLCESFTSVGPEWEESPQTLKAAGDRAFCEGLNQIFLHTYGHSPSLTAKPGFAYLAGSQINRNTTWWEQSTPFFDYLARCQWMLRQGLFVADVCYYYGDGFDPRVPLKQVDPSLGPGYDYDVCNTEVILTRMAARDGRIALPDGMSYRLLVLPEGKALPVEVLRKLKKLAEAGATIVGPRPERDPGLTDYPRRDEEVGRLTAALWGNVDGKAVKEVHCGKGRFIWGKPLREILTGDGVLPDFDSSGGDKDTFIDYIHRTVNGAEIYFVANRFDRWEEVTCTFRVAGRVPELWDPLTGKMSLATQYLEKGGLTRVPLQLPPSGSLFVVFRKSARDYPRVRGSRNWPLLEPALELGGPWRLTFPAGWGAPPEARLEKLASWSKHPDAGIKYFSGTATYHKTFDRPAMGEGRRLWLELGEVHEVAGVTLNGKSLGVLWAKPFRVEITGLLKPRDNELTVAVTNLWPNRLIGDQFLPPEKRLTQTNVTKFTRDYPLLLSGLLGPVRVLREA